MASHHKQCGNIWLGYDIPDHCWKIYSHADALLWHIIRLSTIEIMSDADENLINNSDREHSGDFHKYYN